ncbi:MAG: hypothetical protein UT37_C0001G0034 [Parcubacteria group bacterium GW2011_GWA2_39_18]|nr:MAG: hypothetical protein UT37_C0001G0034 [Parcubacteria group bacterium GW2011_GWA2_39_18]
MEPKEDFGAKNKFMRKITFKICRWCVPSEHNGHFPHIWREKPFKVLVFALIFLQCLSLILILGMPQTKVFAIISEGSLVKLTNEARGENGLLDLSWNESLAKAAQLKAEDMLSKNYFAHDSPQGTAPWYWIQKAGYKYHFAGENLAMNFTGSQSVSDAWLKSPSHRANILNSNYSEIGIAVKSGKINGKETTVVVEFFASPPGIKAGALGTLKLFSSKPSSVNQLPDSNSSPKTIFSTVAPAFTVAPLISSMVSAPRILASAVNQSSQESWPKQKATSLASLLLSLPNKLITLYILVFVALIILTALNVIVKFNVQNGKALLHSGASLAIILSLIALQHLILASFNPIIL